MTQFYNCSKCDKLTDNNDSLCNWCRIRRAEYTIKVNINVYNENRDEAIKDLKRKLDTLKRNYKINSYEITDILEKVLNDI